MSAAEIFVDIVNGMTPDLDALYEGSKGYALGDWKLQQNGLVSGSGALAVAIPGLHLVGLAADVAFVLNRMGVASYGVGAIRGYDEGVGNILEPEDFAAVLLYWSDDAEIRKVMEGKGAATLTTKVGLKVGVKVFGAGAAPQITKMLLSSSGYLVGRKFGGKAAAKAAAKFAAKFGSKALAGFVPFLGPAVGGGVNLWLLNSVMEAADEFYAAKIRLVQDH